MLDQLHKKAFNTLGIKFFSMIISYCIRCGIAPRYTENHTNPITLPELLGHRALKTLKRYAHPSFEHKTEAIKQVEKLNAKAV